MDSVVDSVVDFGVNSVVDSGVDCAWVSVVEILEWTL